MRPRPESPASRALRGLPPIALFTVIVLCAGGLAAQAPTTGPSSPATRVSEADFAARRITVIGASVSSGFGVRIRTQQPDGSRPVMGVDFATVLLAAATRPEVEVRSHATSMFFSDPTRWAKSSVERAIADRPTLVLAIDWIFWSAYGSRGVDGKPMDRCEDRLALLQSGLTALEPLAATGVPIVLGNLPDLHTAIDGGMITESMVPDAACLSRLNERVAAWAASHPSVMLLDLADVVRRTLAGQPVRACNRDWCATDLGPMFQKDRLHPTINGTLAVVAAALDAADRGTGGACTKCFDMDPARVRERLAAMTPAQVRTSAAAPSPPAAADSPSRPSP